MLHSIAWYRSRRRVRIVKQVGSCIAPQYVAEELLRTEGFTDVHFVQGQPTAKWVGLGKADFSLSMAPTILFQHEAGLPVMALAGVHPGCFELFAHPPIRTISDLKGKTVDTTDPFGSGAYLFMAIMAAHVGLDLRKDINWVASGGLTPSIELFAQGKTDAFLASAPDGEEVRARKLGKVILNTTIDSHGLSIIVACWPSTRIMCATIRRRPSAWCAPF